MGKKMPFFLKHYPEEIFKKIATPGVIIILLSGFIMRGWQFGNSTGDGFDIAYALGGLLLFEVVSLLAFLSVGGRNIYQLTRFQIMYLGFVPNISFAYLKRFTDLSFVFSIREDILNGRIAGAVALWYPKPASLLQIVIPIIILMVMVWNMTEKNNGLERPTDVSGKPIHRLKTFTDGKLPGWYKPMFIVAAVLLVLILFWANLTNLVMFIASLLLVCIIWDMWERIRKNRSLEPTIMVSWAELCLFAAMWLKGLVENLGL